jgi:antitoxin ParD1/3/4
MKIELSPKIQKLIKDRVESGKYRRPEDVVTAAMSSLDQQESFGDFAPGELDRLLNEGERDIAAGDVIDGDQAFAELRRLSAKKRKKAG